MNLQYFHELHPEPCDNSIFFEFVLCTRARAILEHLYINLLQLFFSNPGVDIIQHFEIAQLSVYYFKSEKFSFYIRFPTVTFMTFLSNDIFRFAVSKFSRHQCVIIKKICNHSNNSLLVVKISCSSEREFGQIFLVLLFLLFLFFTIQKINEENRICSGITIPLLAQLSRELLLLFRHLATHAKTVPRKKADQDEDKQK